MLLTFPSEAPMLMLKCHTNMPAACGRTISFVQQRLLSYVELIALHFYEDELPHLLPWSKLAGSLLLHPMSVLSPH